MFEDKWICLHRWNLFVQTHNTVEYGVINFISGSMVGMALKEIEISIYVYEIASVPNSEH